MDFKTGCFVGGTAEEPTAKNHIMGIIHTTRTVMNTPYLSCHYDMPRPTRFGGAFLCPQPSLNPQKQIQTDTRSSARTTRDRMHTHRGSPQSNARSPNLHDTLALALCYIFLRQSSNPQRTIYALRARRARKYCLSIISSHW